MNVADVSKARRLARGHEKSTKDQLKQLAREAKEIVKIVEEQKRQQK
jgi:hypothetical protein